MLQTCVICSTRTPYPEPMTHCTQDYTKIVLGDKHSCTTFGYYEQEISMMLIHHMIPLDNLFPV